MGAGRVSNPGEKNVLSGCPDDRIHRFADWHGAISVGICKPHFGAARREYTDDSYQLLRKEARGCDAALVHIQRSIAYRRNRDSLPQQWEITPDYGKRVLADRNRHQRCRSRAYQQPDRATRLWLRPELVCGAQNVGPDSSRTCGRSCDINDLLPISGSLIKRRAATLTYPPVLVRARWRA